MKDGGLCHANDGSIDVDAYDIVGGGGDAHVVDVPSLALSLPDHLLVLLQGQSIATPSFKSRRLSDRSKSF